MFYLLNNKQNEERDNSCRFGEDHPYEDLFNPDQSHHFTEKQKKEMAAKNKDNIENSENPEHPEESCGQEVSKDGVFTPNAESNKEKKNPEEISEEVESSTKETEEKATSKKNGNKVTVSRPPSGKKQRPITAKLKTGNQAEDSTSRPSSGRPPSGKVRPQSGVKRKSIPSRKDSLLMLHGGSDTEDGTYGKSDDDELENIMAIKTNKSLPGEEDDESDEELRVLMTKIGDDDPLSSNTNIKELESPKKVLENNSKESISNEKDKIIAEKVNEVTNVEVCHINTENNKESTNANVSSLDNNNNMINERDSIESIHNSRSSKSINSLHSTKSTTRSNPKEREYMSFFNTPDKNETLVSVDVHKSSRKSNNSDIFKTNENNHSQSVMDKRNEYSPVDKRLVKSVDTSNKLTTNPLDDIPLESELRESCELNLSTDTSTWGMEGGSYSNRDGNKTVSTNNTERENYDETTTNNEDEKRTSSKNSVYTNIGSSTPQDEKNSSANDKRDINNNTRNSRDEDSGTRISRDENNITRNSRDDANNTRASRDENNVTRASRDENNVTRASRDEGSSTRNSIDKENNDTNRSDVSSSKTELNLNLGEDTNSTYSNESSRHDVDEEEGNTLRKPKWHPPWQLKKEIIAHSDAIPVLVIDPSNRWFATGSADRTVKLWDINSGRQKLVIKAHKQSIRAMTFGATGHRQLFTTGDDRQLLCHDVEVNRVTAKFKGQSAVIYGITAYQPSHLLITAGRDKLLKIYDTRSTKCIKTLRGHQNTVSCVQAIDETRQIVSGSHDSTLRLWDIGEGRCVNVLQGHVKSVRALAQKPEGSTILSASSERVLAWNLPHGEIVQEIQAENIAINSITVNHNGVTVAGGSNGVMHLWDFNSGHRFQKIHRTRVYESQEIPICVFSTKFDHSGSKLLCADACNVVKIYREAFTKSRPILDVRYVQPTDDIPLGKNYIVPDSPKKE